MSKKVFMNDKLLKVLTEYLDNYTKRLHGRLLAKFLKMNQKTVSLALNKLYVLGVMDYTQMGKNKEYNLRIDSVITKHYLTMAETYKTATFMQNSPEIRKIIEDLKSHECFEGVILIFGSFATGTFGEESDLDLFVIGKTDNTEIKKVQATSAREISVKTATKSQFGRAIRKKDALTEEIIRHHIVIEKIDEFVDILWGYFNEVRQA